MCGLDVISRLPDIEAQLAPTITPIRTPSSTHSTAIPVRANITTKINDHWTVQGGISPGCDMIRGPRRQINRQRCRIYTWTNGGDDLYTCANTINDGKYAYNNLTAYYATWYHRFRPLAHGH